MPTPLRVLADLSLRHAPDAELLALFRQGDHAAFELLVWRHRRLVLGVCRRVARDGHDAEDAFQATFLVLARRAAAVRGPTLAGWLTRVAYRSAVRVRAKRRFEPAGDLSLVPAAEPPAADTGLAAVLDAELDRLPERYRVPVVLCYLHGKTYHQAAAELDCPLGTLCGRLTRAKALLRTRLVRRGVTLGVGGLASYLAGLTPTAAAADGLARSVSASAAAPTRAVAVADEVLRMMTGKSPLLATTAAAVVLVLGLAATVVGLDPPKTAPAAKPAPPATANGIRGTVTDAAGGPVEGATVVAAGGDGSGMPRRTTTDAKGRFAFDAFPAGQAGIYATNVIAAAAGHAPAVGYASPNNNPELSLVLPKPAAFAGVVKDRAGKPVAGAEVQFGVVHRSGGGSSWSYVPAAGIRGTPVGAAYLTKTDAAGAFAFDQVPAGAEIILRVMATGFAELDTAARINKREHVATPDAKPADLVLDPEAVIRGRVTSRVAGVATGDVRVRLHPQQHGIVTATRLAAPDADGRFELKQLPAGEYGVYLWFPASAKATAAGVTVSPQAGGAAEANLEIIEGVEVSGVVKVKGGGPVAGVTMTASGSFNPGFDTVSGPTDAEGRFRLRLPPGEATVGMWGMPAGYSQPRTGWGDRRKLTVPAKEPVALPDPFEVVPVAAALVARVTDAAGRPLAHAKVSALNHASVCGDFSAAPVAASWDGEATLTYAPNGPLEEGRSVPLRVEGAGGVRYEANAIVGKGGAATVRVPTRADAAGPKDVKPDELAGLVVDEAGKPLAGAAVILWDRPTDPECVATTGTDGVFRFPKLDPKQQYLVRVRKDGFSHVLVARQAVGVKGLVVALDRATYFEGVVRSPGGKPAAGAVVRADQGPKMVDGAVHSHVWTETTADAAGRYRLYVQPDEYEFHVKAAGVGVALLPRTGVAHGRPRTLDVPLQPGITFTAHVIDSVSGKPVPGLRLYDWADKSIEGRADARGEVAVKDLLPGEFTFQVESATHARWWSEQSPREWERKTIDDRKTGWQRNFDGLTFALEPGMVPVTIVAEPAVRVTGRVLDPDGKPVGGATVAPARTGSGNSLTGDTRFSVETKADGTFAMTLPASGAAEYNLVAHDGKYGEWRAWANGVLPPVKTAPGQEIEGVSLSLTRPATVRGRVVDAAGKPVAGREVRAHASDRRENRYYDPTATTRADGTFELKFVRPAGQWVQVAPFWLSGDEAPAGTSKTLTPKAGEVVEGVELTAAEEPPK